MPEISSVADLFEALGRNPDELIGLPEAEWLDFKKEPYYLDNDAHRQELAKDVSALANGGEGIIVLGVDTTQNPQSKVETASELRPIADGLVDAKQLQETIRSWVWPRLDVEIKSHPVPERPGNLWTLLVGRQRDRDLPFLVMREYLTENKLSGLAFGIYRRHSSENVPYSPQQVHGWVHRGFSDELDVSERVPDTSLEELAQAILDDDVRALAIPDGRLSYYLQAHPPRAVQLSAFYEGGSGTVHDALRQIPSVRGEWGFNLPDGTPDPTAQDCLRVVWGEETSVSISRTGVLTAVFTQRYLTWGTERHQQEGQVWINPLALVEFTLEFWRFFRSQVLDREPSPSRLAWRAGMRHLGGPYHAALPKGRLKDFPGLNEVGQALVEDFELSWTYADELDPEALAFQTLIEIYAKFGLGEAFIPYSDSNDRRVQQAVIAAIR